MAATDVTEHATAAEEGGPRMYLRVIRTEGMPAWTLAVVCQRLPIAMSPLALVYLGKHVSSSYAIGALLAGAFAFAEAVAAGPMGRRFDRNSPRSELRLVLGLQALLLGALVVPALVAPGWMPTWLMLLLAAGAGAVASGAHGGLRALLVRTVVPSAHHAALSLESMMTTLLWAVGPAVVGLVVLFSGQAWPMAVIAVIAAAGVLVAGALKDSEPAAAQDVETEKVRVWRLSWPALLQEGAVLMCVGAAYTGLPPLLEEVGANAGIAGPALAVFAAAGLVGGLVYGSRRWRGAYRTHSMVLALAVAVIVGLAVVMPVAAMVIALMIVSGLAGTPALTARAAGIQELLPERVWATGFSGLYAAGGVGFGAAGAIVAALLAPSGVRVALLVCVAVAALAVLVGGIVEARMAPSAGTAPSPDSPGSEPATATGQL